MNQIKKIIRAIFKIISEAIWGYAVGLFILTLIVIALKELLKAFIDLGYIQTTGIVLGLITLLGIIDYVGNYEFFITISEKIEDLCN